ncbi:UbiA family prenyltransferase [Micromonospora schwarzwaldensis]|uniref:UbiA family prenyltransferase n=1 Tax=Micromonospora sp. DSM 45708 TaxID=3111767 RepID=UPI0031D515CD
MTGRWGRYVAAAYPPAVHLPFMLSWAIGLTALFAAVTEVPRWRPDGGLAVTAVTLVVGMLLLRAMDDIRDHEYDRRHHPHRPLPAGVVRERDLMLLVALGAAALLLLNAGRGVVLAALAGQLGYAAVVITLDRVYGWPSGDRLALHLAVNLPIQPLLSIYVYAGFLHAQGRRPDLAGVLAIVAVTLSGVCLEFGRKATRRPRAGERTYSTVLGPWGTTAVALGAAVLATGIVLGLLRPWQSGAGHAWGWLALAPLALPVAAASRFVAGAPRWPVGPTIAYIPVMYASYLAVGWLTKGASA